MAASVEFRLEGFDVLADLVANGRKKLPQAISQALYQFAEEVMTDSKEVVPVLTGALMSTGKVFQPEVDGSSVTVELGYGDEAVGYAIYVHEELDSPSGNPINYTRPGSGPKYLERPLLAKQDQLPQRVVDAVKQAFAK